MRNDSGWDDANPARKRAHVQVQKDYEGVQMKSSREQFEEWIANTTSSDLHGRIMLDKSENGSYRHIATNNKWSAWQASRAAIEIELPDITDAQYQSKHIEGGFRAEAFWLQVRKCIENVGLKVKS